MAYPFDNSQMIQLTLKNYEEFIKLIQSLEYICVTVKPAVDELFCFEKTLGKGTQALINLYTKKDSETQKKYAIKSYLLGKCSADDR